ncbi:FAD-dependent oxidoreductase [Flavihumibacter sp. UBA7668]|uniref:FAD-dependent oxidoreductase n=1 Tax=Flavihumibacter sp. UBA7668 TaxID=1946542 RepID=UPI0025C1FA28|nr:FAD-dependent oxidoreductase [Flavihumibacter sp. UBA7668]
MRFIEEEKKQLPVYNTPEVLVVGAGPAGLGAAIAAARNGARVLLLERYGFLGGNLTIAMVNPMFTFHDIMGKQVIRGIAGELVDRLVQLKSSQGHVTDLTFDNASMTPFDPEGMKYLLFEMVKEAGVELLLHTWAVGVTKEGEKVTGVIIENKSGRQIICPQYIIDCSADADIVAMAKSPFVKGRKEDGAMQPVTLFFRIGGINVADLRKWMKNNRELLKDSPTDEEIDSSEALAFLGLKELVKMGMENGEFPKDAAPRILFYQLPMEGQIAVNATRLQGIDGTNAADLTRAEIETRVQAWEIHKFLQKYVGGFEHSFIVDTGVQVGVRETRHIIGDYELTEEDVLSNRAFEDGIACGTFAIDIHPPEGENQVFTGSGKAVYEIPYRSLLPKGLNNVLVAGRAISATHNAFGSARVMATCMGIGQGAGVAIASIVKDQRSTREVNTAFVRKQLIDQGQYLLGMPDDAMKADDKLILHKVDGSGATASHFNPFKDIGHG